MAEQRKDWADEERPADMGRRRFLQATLVAGAAAVTATAVAGAKSLMPPPFTFRGTIEDSFRYGLPERADDWVARRNLVNRVVRVTDFALWDGASVLWRQAFDDEGTPISGTGFPAMIICVDRSLLLDWLRGQGGALAEFEEYVIPWDIDGDQAAFVGLSGRCVHLCCKPGWHLQPLPGTFFDEFVVPPRTLLANPRQDPIWCQCHNSQYDPVTLVENAHPPNIKSPRNVPYIGARYVHGPATRALPCIPLRLSGTTPEGIYDPEEGGHPEWYSAYC
jgi:Rieske Fe-S protein